MKPVIQVFLAALALTALATGCQTGGRPAACPVEGRPCPVSQRAYGPCGAAGAEAAPAERWAVAPPYGGYLEAHADFEQPFALLGGPLQAIVSQSSGGVQLALPDRRELDPHVFGTPRAPRAIAGTPIMTGIPLSMRQTRGGEYTQLKEESPFGRRTLSLPQGRLSLNAFDITATDAAMTQDSVRLEAEWKDSDGNTYTVRCDSVLEHGLEHPTFGGVVTNHIMHGVSGIGTPLLPTEFAYLAFFGTGETLKNGQVTDDNILIQGMLTERIRTAEGGLAFDNQVAPSRLQMLIFAPPLIIESGELVEDPVRTGFMLPDGEELPFWLVTFENIEVEAERLPVRASAAMGDGGSPLQISLQNAAAVVEMNDELRYAPSKVTIKSGEIVEWKNLSQLTHTVTADPSLAIDKSHAQLPEGAEPFNSGNIPPGKSFSFGFTIPGLYRYFCIPHEANGMIGEVLVEKADAS